MSPFIQQIAFQNEANDHPDVAVREGAAGPSAERMSSNTHTRRSLLATASLASMLALAGCGVVSAEKAKVRFKITATVIVDGKTYTGSAVNELVACYTPNSLSGFQMSRRMSAEATIVDVGRRDALFVLLVDYLDRILRAYNIAPSVGSADDMTVEKLKAARGEVGYEETQFERRRDLPLIAAFHDESDPTSVYEVDPENMAATHGPGARLVGVSIEIVDPETPLTEAVQKRLVWLVVGSSDRLVQPFRTADDPTASFGQIISSRSFIAR